MAKSQKRYLVLLGFGLLVIIAAGVWMVFGRKTQIYEKTEEIFGNPLMGYAPCAWEETIGEDISLLYMDITWAELEPAEGKYDWEKIERENQTDRWREEGKHLVLRLCVIFPGRKSIWTFHNGYMTKLIMREPGMIWSMERDMLLIIIMNR